MHHRPLVIRPHLDWAMLRWSLATLRNCTAARYRVNKTRMVRLAEYSRDCLRALRAATGIAYDERMQGTLQLFRTQKQFDGSAGDVAVLRQSGVAFELLDREGCIRHEPALARVREKFVGGLLLPGDETGDCFKFTQRLAELARERGVEFRFGTTIRALERSGDRVVGVATDAGRVDGRCLRRRARQLFTAAARADRLAHSRSIRSRATRSPCRSATPQVRPSRP